MRLKYNFLSKDGHEEVRLIECTEICQTDNGHIGIYAAEMNDVISQNKISDSDYKHILNELSDKGYYDLTSYGLFRQDEEDIDDPESVICKVSKIISFILLASFIISDIISITASDEKVKNTASSLSFIFVVFFGVALLMNRIYCHRCLYREND